MRKTLVIATAALGFLHAQAQEKVMNVWKADGTSTQTRVADLKQISFLCADGESKGMQICTVGGETVAVLFEADPIVTAANGTLTVKPSEGEAVEFEIEDIAEILFSDKANSISATGAGRLSCTLQAGGVLVSGIPQGAQPLIYSADGRSLPTPPLHGGQMTLSRATLGTGVFIVKVGTLSTKVSL